MNPLAFLGGLPNAIKGYIAGALLTVIVGLVIALFLTRHTLADRTKDLAICNMKRSLDEQSIVELKGDITKQNAAVDQLQASGDKLVEAVNKAQAGAQARDKAAAGRLSRLDADARRAPAAGCPAAKSTLDARGLL